MEYFFGNSSSQKHVQFNIVPLWPLLPVQKMLSALIGACVCVCFLEENGQGAAHLSIQYHKQ